MAITVLQISIANLQCELNLGSFFVVIHNQNQIRKQSNEKAIQFQLFFDYFHCSI